MQMSLAEQRL